MLSTPGGTHYWVPCAEKAVPQTLAEMGQAAFVYGPGVWESEKTVVRFGTSDGTTFTPTKHLRGPQES